jgi:peptide/nickel transport system substrate-binding protein
MLPSRPLTILIVLVLCTVNGCGQRAANEPPGDEQPEAKMTTLRVGLAALPPMLGNPYGSISIPTIYTWAAMFDALTYVTVSGQVEPALATSWEAVDENTWRFELRRGVTFHNGEPFNAAAIVAAIAYLTSPEAVRDTIAREMRVLERAEAIDEHAVLIHTREPAALLPANMAQMFVVAPQQWQRLGPEGFAREPAGTGPFRLVRWVENGAELEAFRESWRPPRVDRLIFKQMPDQIARIQGIQTGQLDIAVALSPEDAAALEAAAGQLDYGPSASVLGIAFILEGLDQDHPLRDQRVRQALNYAVDKERYLEVLFGGHSRPASQPATAAAFGYNDDLLPYRFDPARARQLLTEAGYPDGFSFTMEAAVGGGAADAAVYQTVANDLSAIGVNMRIQVIPISQLIRRIQGGGWGGQAFGMNYNAERTTDGLRFTRLHSCIPRSPWFCDEQLTARIQRANSTWDLAKKRAQIRAILAAYREQAVAIWLHEIVYAQGIGPRVKGFQQDNAFIRYDLIELDNQD